MTFMQSHIPRSTNTPNPEKSEGLKLTNYMPAKYLPILEVDPIMLEGKVIRHGKVVSLDADGYVVPVGLQKDIEKAIELGSDAWALSNVGEYANVYTATDVSNSVKNYAGTLVVAGEPVVASFFTGAAHTAPCPGVTTATAALGTQGNTIGKPLGFSAYDYWRHNGDDMDNGGALRNESFRPQHKVTVITKSLLTLPMVADAAGTKLAGMAVFEASSAPAPGSLVTYDAKSNYVTWSPVDYSSLAVATTGFQLKIDDEITGSAYASTTPDTLEDTLISAEYQRVIDEFNTIVSTYVPSAAAIDDTEYSAASANDPTDSELQTEWTRIATEANAILSAIDPGATAVPASDYASSSPDAATDAEILAEMDVLIDALNTSLADVDLPVAGELDRIVNGFNSAISTIVKNVNTTRDVVGIVSKVDSTWPKDHADYINAWNPSTTDSNRRKPSGTAATDGLPEHLYMAGETDASSAVAIDVNFFTA